MISEAEARGGFTCAAIETKNRKKNVKLTPLQREQAGEGKLDKHWRTYFLQALAATSNVTVAAKMANASPSRAYKARREDADFAKGWRAALLEGYDHLEMEMLGYLRDPEPKRKMDVSSALRLLIAHRETVARERALTDDGDEQAVLESIDRFIDEMRERRAINTAILIETEIGDGAD